MNLDEDTKSEDLSGALEIWKTSQKQKKKLVGVITKKKRKIKKKKPVRTSDDQSINIQKLPSDFLEDLEEEKSSQKETNDKSTKKKNLKRKLKSTSALINKDYIPLDANCATNFRLVQLDKNPTSFSTQTAEDFYRKKLSRTDIQREPAKNLNKYKEKKYAKFVVARHRKSV